MGSLWANYHLAFSPPSDPHTVDRLRVSNTCINDPKMLLFGLALIAQIVATGKRECEYRSSVHMSSIPESIFLSSLAMIPLARSGFPAGYSFPSYSASFKKKKPHLWVVVVTTVWLYRIGPCDTIPSSLNNNSFVPDITRSPPKRTK